MGWFRHPHLVRGVVHTIKGSFVIARGVVQAPDDIGEFYGWLRLDPADHTESSTLERSDDRRLPAEPSSRRMDMGI